LRDRLKKSGRFMLAASGGEGTVCSEIRCRLRQCYEYWDQAIDNPDHRFSTRKQTHGSSQKRSSVAGLRSFGRWLAGQNRIRKACCNDAHMDERHARRRTGQKYRASTLRPTDRAQVHRDILAAYESVPAPNSDQLVDEATSASRRPVPGVRERRTAASPACTFPSCLT